MKNKKWYSVIITVVIVAVAIVGVMIWRSTLNETEDVKFQRTSNEFVYVGESSVDIVGIYTDCKDIENFKLLQPKDYSSTAKIDPAYWVEPATEGRLEDGDIYQFSGNFQIPLVQGMEYTLSTIEYEYNGERKTADIGRYKVSYEKGQDLYEERLDVDGEKDVVLVLNTTDYGELVKAEVVNKDLKTTVKVDQKLAEASVYLQSPSFKGYDELITNMKYTFEKDGKQTVYYGTTALSFNVDNGLNYTVSHIDGDTSIQSR